MKSVTLRRLWSGTHGTFGRLSLDGKSWWSLERPLDGAHCAIPAGAYFLSLGMFYGGDGVGGKPDYPAYIVGNVPGRVEIKLHVANAASQLMGCIALGLAVGFPSLKDGSQPLGLMSSGDAFQAFMRMMSGQPGEITIVESF